MWAAKCHPIFLFLSYQEEVHCSKISLESADEIDSYHSHQSFLTDWLCGLLTSNFATHYPFIEDKRDPDARCQCKGGETCRKILSTIKTTEPFITLSAAIAHQEHFKILHVRTTRLLKLQAEPDIILAYYQERGLRYRIFGIDEETNYVREYLVCKPLVPNWS